MQKKILGLCLQFLIISAYAENPQTACGKDPALAQKKMTHILRSIACSQAKTIQECEEVEGLFPAVAPAATAGSLAMVTAVQKYRPENLAGCRFSSINIYNKNMPVLNIFYAEPAIAAPACGLLGAENYIDQTTRSAILEADGLILRQTEEIAKQTRNVETLAEAAKKAELAAQEMKAAEAAYYATDVQMKDLNKQIEDLRAQIRENVAAREGMAPTSQKYSYYKTQSEALIKQRGELMQRLQARKVQVGMPEEFRARLQAASTAKSQAEAAKSSAEKLLGKIDDQARLLESQKRRLAEISKARAEYSRVIKPGTRIIASPTGTQNAVDALRSVGAISEGHSKSLRHLDFLLDSAARTEMQSMQRFATSQSVRESARIAMTKLGQKAAVRVGVKIIGGVLVAATGPIAMAADVSIELGLLGAPPSDGHCLDDNIDKLSISHLTSFTQANKCKSTPIIADIAQFRKIMDLSSDEQLRLFNNGEFCNWLDNVYQVHAPKMKVSCQGSGATYQTPTGKNVQFSLNPDGSMKKFDSYGSENEMDDFMYSVNFENNAPQTLGVFAPNRQYLMERSFNANAFKTEFQTKYDFSSTSAKVKMNDIQYTALKRSFRSNILAMTEIKSCCNPQSPAIEDATCFTRYGIKAKEGTTPPSRTPSTAPANRSI